MSTSPAPVPSLSITPNIPEPALAQFIIVIVGEFIALVAVVLRIYARWIKGGTFYLNDYAIFWAFAWASAFTGANLAFSLQGAQGQHILVIQELVPERMTLLAKLFVAIQITWAPANAGVKLSMIHLYLKIFGTNTRLRICSYILAGLVLAYFVLVTLLTCLICTPFAYNWDKTISGGHCGNLREDYMATGILNFVLDILVLVLPMPVLWGLNMRLKKKLGLAFMFGIGFIICGITIWRLVLIKNYDFNDPYYNLPYLLMTSALEPLLGITNATLPILVAPFAAMRNNLISSWRTKSTSKLSKLGGISGGGSSSFKPSGADSQSDTKNFNRLYDHLYPHTRVATTCVAEPIELQPISPRRGQGQQKDDTIQLTTAWETSRSDAES